MRLITKDVLDIDFVKFLTNKMRIWFNAYVNYDRWDVFESYFNILYPKKIKITSEYICDIAFKHLITQVDISGTIIQFDQNIKLPNYDIRLIEVLELMNYGTIAIPPYSIFSEMFKYFQDNLENYETLYYRY